MSRTMAWIAALLMTIALVDTVSAATAGVVVQPVKGEFADVKERVVQAIESRGLVINYTAHISDMLDRTGKDIGREKQVYAKAEIIEFCSAKISRDTMEADPRNILFCPYAIAIYALPKEQGRVYVGYRKPVAVGSSQSVRAMRAVEKLLADIVQEAVK